LTDPARCSGTNRDGSACTLPAGPSGLCYRHDPEAAAERGRAGRAKQVEQQRAERSERAAAVILQTVEDIRAVLEQAAGMAYAQDDPGAMIRAAAAAMTLLRAEDLARATAEGRPGTASPIRLVWPEDPAA
jgi:hypothetical protein